MHHRAEPHVFAPCGDPLRHREHWAATVAQANATTFLAADADRVVGFITVSVVEEVHSLLQPMRFGRIGSIGVTSDHRGRGVGRVLVAAAQEWAETRGCVEVRLTVGAFNKRAARLYEELGYEVRSMLLVRSFA